jgi:hypothetical protein
MFSLLPKCSVLFPAVQLSASGILFLLEHTEQSFSEKKNQNGLTVPVGLTRVITKVVAARNSWK